MKLVEIVPGRYQLEGTATAANADSIRAAVDAVLRRKTDEENRLETFDLSAVVDGNSVVIALMMGWLREAARQNCQISYLGVPERLYELIEFYGLDDVLPVAEHDDVT